MATRILGGGFCFGLLDPASNIVANTLIRCTPDAAAAGESSLMDYEAAGDEELKDLESRSLDAMVTFLTRFFPYLADCEALFYLLLADADLLVATRIIVVDRRMKRFGSSETAVAEALLMSLKCAALAARHPDADRLVGAWMNVSTRLDEAVRLLAKVRRRSGSGLKKLARLLDGPRPPVDYSDGDLLKVCRLATSRCPHPRSVPYQNSSTGLKRTLLDAIHGFYLQALARLPANELRSRYHRSLLMAGHCYGPLDPISNIILNTIWYDAAFPPAVKLELDMVSTPGLHRIETRSLYGLVSFLCTRYHHLNFHRALHLLLHADSSLQLADPEVNASRTEEQGLQLPWWNEVTGFHDALGSSVDTQAQSPATSVNGAFKAAAIAAWHPNPDAQANLLASCKELLGSALSLLQGGGQLSIEDVQQLARLLVSHGDSPCQQPLQLTTKEYLRVDTRISERVNTILNAYAQMSNGEPMYELHAICGVNDQVSGPVYCPESDACPPEKFYRSHVNFLAALKGTHSNETPILFFAELSNDEEAEAQTRSFCCPVCVPLPCAERVRCLYCDHMGTRVVHPIGKNFHGRKDDFEKMACREDPFDKTFDPRLMRQYYTNTKIVCGGSIIMAEKFGTLEEDRLYTDGDSESDEDSDSYDEC